MIFPRYSCVLLFLIYLSQYSHAHQPITGFAVDVDLSYSEANPDFSIFENGEGISLYANVTYEDSWMFVARYNDADFQPSGPVAGGVIETWQSFGLGYGLDFAEAWRTEVILTSQRIKNEENSIGSESGSLIQIGARFEPSGPLGFALHVGKLDLLIDDWTLDFEARFSFDEHFYSVARLRDYADWDFTYYEVGLGFSF